MKEKIEKNKWLFKQFTMINRTAMSIYEAVQGGVGMNFYSCHCEYENGVFGWVKESRAFQIGLEIYEQYTSNDGWEIISELERIFEEELANISYEEISELEIELRDVELN